ncbi:MAG: hypothetical protein AAGC93_20285 [Cyanobacteria bacterium P01_F01_bin.53]
MSARFADDLDQGQGLYCRFNRFSATQVQRIRHDRRMPPAVVSLGELVGLMYRSDKWQQGQPRTYIHRMETPPQLVCDVTGSQLYIVGGNYRVTARGIEG